MTTRTDSPGELAGAYHGALFSRATRDIDRDSISQRTPLAIAILSVAFQESIYLSVDADGAPIDIVIGGLQTGLIFGSAVLCLFSKTSWSGVALFTITAAFFILPTWMVMANHTWLAMWTIPLALIFRRWWLSDFYSYYLRITLGIVMIAAFAQKGLAGTYVDGTFIYYLSKFGGTTERLFSFACDLTADAPCLAHKLIGQFILLWQLAVGVLLLWGIRSLIFLTIEVGFLLGAGLFANEMNFQVLNIALLCIAFQVGMPNWLVFSCLILLLIDLFGVGYLYLELINVF